MKTKILIILVVVMSFFTVACTTTSGLVKNDQDQRLADEWGVEIVGARLSAAGYMIDFRYKVLDPEKAKPLFKLQTKPSAIYDKTGDLLHVPSSAKIGALRQRASVLEKDKIFFIFFGNPARTIKSGETISVTIGDFKAEHIKVM